MDRATQQLIKIVESRSCDHRALSKATESIRDGADITVTTKYGYLIDIASEEYRRLKEISSPRALNYLYIVQLLEKTACERLAMEILTNPNSHASTLNSLKEVKGNCQQIETYGTLGLLGTLLSQENIPIALSKVRFLIENDPDPTQKLTANDDKNRTCMHIAKSNTKCPREVIEYLGQQLNTILNQIPFKDPSIDHNKIISLISDGANLEFPDATGNTILCHAANGNNLSLVRFLVTIGSETNHKNHQGLRPLDIANKAEPRNPPLIEFLRQQDMNIQFSKLIKQKRSMLTAKEVHDILENGAQINCPMSGNETALHVLINHGCTEEMLRLFVEELNADLTIENDKGFRAIEACILRDTDQYPLLKALLKLPKMSIDKFKKLSSSETILQFAIKNNRSGAARLIQDELNQRLWNTMVHVNTDEDKNRAIMVTLNELIEFGAQINSIHDDDKHLGWTVLHLACKLSSAEMVMFLIEKMKADVTIKSADGDTALFVATQYGHFNIIKYLHEYQKMRLNTVNKNEETPLHLATKQKHLIIIKYLVKWGADNLARNKSGQTPLDIARQNVSHNKEEEIANRKIIGFLEQLICPVIDSQSSTSSSSKQPSYDMETCELVNAVEIKQIQMSTEGMHDREKHLIKDFLLQTPNESLYRAAKEGILSLAIDAIANGADIRYRKHGLSIYEIAMKSHNDYATKIVSGKVKPQEIGTTHNIVAACQQIAERVSQIAHTKIHHAIEQSNEGLVVAYHLAGAPLTVDLVYKTCQVTDNVEIVDYLLANDPNIYSRMMEDLSDKSPYHIAIANQSNKIASYFKYRLSKECTNAIKTNNILLVKQLVKAGANVDTNDTFNLNEAIRQESIELIQILCENGAKMPQSWLSDAAMELTPTILGSLNPDIVTTINRYIIERRLRFAAANGNHALVKKCIHNGADIDSVNYHGSSALLCSIQHGNYFEIVHLLVSRGACLLHSNKTEPESLINVAMNKNYKRIGDYLAQKFNEKFLSDILNNDISSAKTFSRLGVDFNCKDEQQQTPLHYAVQHSNVDLVRWLCECGSHPTTPDANGDYPITLATQKGNYAIVKLFVEKYSQTKQQTNRDGYTALQIANNFGHKHIANFIETGIERPTNSEIESNSESFYNEQFLVQQARNGNVKVIQEFIDKIYESRAEKKLICEKMIQAAKAANEREVYTKLEQHYDEELKFDGRSGRPVILNGSERKILLGFLRSLNNVIADTDVLLDPADPNTYTSLFNGWKSAAEKKSKEVEQLKDLNELKKLIEQDRDRTREKLDKLEDQIRNGNDQVNDLQEQLRDVNDRLVTSVTLTATERKRMMNEKEKLEKEFASYNCSISITEKCKESMTIHQKAHEFFSNSSSSIYFYTIIERRLQALFIHYYADHGGFVKSNHNNTSKKITIVNVYKKFIQPVLRPLLWTIDPIRQKQDYDNLANLGSLSELEKIASATAGLLTLYYDEQIKMIDTSHHMKPFNVFNEKQHWIPVIDRTNDKTSELTAVQLFADYITGWIIDGLLNGSGITIGQSLEHQLWFHVAKIDPTDEQKLKQISIMNPLTGRQKIRIENQIDAGQKIVKEVQLRHLMGSPSVIGPDYSVYELSLPHTSKYDYLRDLTFFGYVYIAPFSSDDNVLKTIVESRKMNLVNHASGSSKTDKVNSIKTIVPEFRSLDTNGGSESIDIKHLADAVMQVIREHNVFVDSQALEEILRDRHRKFEISVDYLRETTSKDVDFFRTSIDVATEKIAEEAQRSRNEMKEYSDIRYAEASNQLKQEMNDLEGALKERIKKRMKSVEEKLKEDLQNISKIAEDAQNKSLQALSIAQETVEICKQAASKAANAAKSADDSCKWAQEQHQEFQKTIEECKHAIKQSSIDQKNWCETEVANLCMRTEHELEQSKQARNKSSADAKESKQAAKESEKSARDIQRTVNTLFEQNTEERKKIISETRHIREQSEAVVNEAKEARQQATQAAKTAAEALEKVNKAISTIEKMIKNSTL